MIKNMETNVSLGRKNMMDMLSSISKDLTVE
jgi:hypothetical protein